MESLLNTERVAEILGSSSAFVRSHAAELGGIRLGGPRSPLRFEEPLVRAYLDRKRLTPPTAVVVGAEAVQSARGRRARRTAADVELLPLPGEAAA